MLMGWGNDWPDGVVPEIYLKLQVGKYYEGFLTYSDLTDREESGELFEAALTYMEGFSEAESITRQREEAKAKRNAQLRR